MIIYDDIIIYNYLIVLIILLYKQIIYNFITYRCYLYLYLANCCVSVPN